jgi:hypothetical protein
MLPAQSTATSRQDFSAGEIQDPTTLSKTPSEEARHRHCTPLAQRRSSLPQLGDVRRGILAFGWSPILESQSTRVEVFGEIYVPRPSKCKHQEGDFSSEDGSATSGVEDNQAVEKREGRAQQRPNLAPLQATNVSNVEATSATPASEPPGCEHTVEDHIATAEQFADITSPASPLPQIKILPPTRSASSPRSLGTRLIRHNSAKQLRRKTSAYLRKPNSSERDVHLEPIVDDQLGAMVFGLDRLSSAKPAAAAPVEIPASVVSASRGDRIRLKIRSRTKSAKMKARKMILRKKILALILGKEVGKIVEPHLDAAAGASGGVLEAPGGVRS